MLLIGVENFWHALLVIITSLIGILVFSAATQAWFINKLRWFEIIIFFVISISFLSPVFVLNKHIAEYQRNDNSYMWSTWEKEDFIDQIKIIIECNSRYKNPKVSNYDLSKQIDYGVWKTYLEILGNTIITKRQHIFNMYFIKTIKITNSTFRLYELTILLIKKFIVNIFKYHININL